MSLGIMPVQENIGFSCDGMGSPKDAPGECWVAERSVDGIQSRLPDLWPPLMLDPQWVCECQ